MKNKFIIELIWLISVAAITWIFLRIVVGFSNVFQMIDIPLHDTYFVISGLQIFIFFFGILSFIVYGSRNLFLRFSQRLPAVIFLINTLCLILVFTIVIQGLTFLHPPSQPDGWTIYPVSQHGQIGPRALPWAFLLQFILGAILVTSSVITGKNAFKK